MKKIKQLNNLIIKEKSEKEACNQADPSKKYGVFTPDGILIKEELTLLEAEDLCKQIPKNKYVWRV